MKRQEALGHDLIWLRRRNGVFSQVQGKVSGDVKGCTEMTLVGLSGRAIRYESDSTQPIGVDCQQTCVDDDTFTYFPRVNLSMEV